MSGYLLIKFSERPSKNVDECVCIPESWKQGHEEDGKVAIRYPDEDPTRTMQRVLKAEDYSREWKIYLVTVLNRKDTLEVALKALAEIRDDRNELSDLLNNMTTKDVKPDKKSTTPKDKKTNQGIPSVSNAQKKKEKLNNNVKIEAVNITPKQKRGTSLNNTPKIKKEQDIDNKSQTKNDKNNVDTDPQSISITPKVKQEKPPVSNTQEKNKKPNNDAEMDDVNTAPKQKRGPSANKTPKLKIEHDNEGESHTNVNNNSVDTEPKNKPKCSPLKIPDDFDATKRNHMFRCPEPGEGIVELLPGTNVFIQARDLRVKYKNFTDMSKGLMTAVFTDRALKFCSLSGEPPISKNHQERDTKPMIDQSAREAIILYVYDNCYKHFKEGRNAIEHAMRKALG